MIALGGEAALFIPGYECDSPVAPSDFDRLIEGYPLAQTALLRDPFCDPIWLDTFNLLRKGFFRYGWVDVTASCN